jgi:hypothetical protein
LLALKHTIAELGAIAIGPAVGPLGMIIDPPDELLAAVFCYKT